MLFLNYKINIIIEVVDQLGVVDQRLEFCSTFASCPCPPLTPVNPCSPGIGACPVPIVPPPAPVGSLGSTPAGGCCSC